MAKASLTIAIGGTYDGKAIDKAEKALRDLNTEAARHAGGLTESLTKAGDSAVKLGTDMEGMGAKISGTGAKLTAATAPLAALGAAAVKMASDYEQSIAKVYTIMDKEAMSTEAMSKSILDLSTATGKSATELADAAYQALSASVDTEKVAGFVEDAVKLSKSGFTETATAVDTLTTVINAYGYSADDAAMISDKLVQTQNKGKTTVDELAQSMGNVIPTAAAYNVNLDNLCSAYVVLTKQGINTANATTAINGMLTELADSGSDVAAVLEDQVGKTFGQLMSEGYTLSDVIQILSKSVDGDSEAFANLWGNVRASKGALAIANAGAYEFTETMQAMTDSTGLCDKALDDLATPAAKANKAINAMKNTGIQLGEKIIEAAVPSLEKLSDMAQDLYKWFGDLDEGTKENIVRFGALAVAAGPVLTVFGKMYGSLGSLIKGFGKGLQNIGAFSAAMKATEAEMKAAGAASVTLGAKVQGAAQKTGILTKATSLLKGSLAAIGIAAAVAAVGFLVGKYQEWKEHTDTVEKATRGLEEAVGKAKAAYDECAPSIEGAARALDDVAISSDEALKKQADLADSMSETWKDVGTDAAMVDAYAQTIAELGNKGALTDEELVRLQTAVEGFNGLTGASIDILNAETGELNTNKDAVLGLAEAYKEEAKAAAAKEMLKDLNKQLIEDNLALKSAQDELSKAEADYETALKESPESIQYYIDAVGRAQAKVDEMQGAIDSAKQSEQDLVDLISQSPTHFKTIEDALASCGTKFEDFGDLTDDELSDLQSSFDGTLSSIYNACVDNGWQIPQGLADGIESNAYAPSDAIWGVGDILLDTFKNALGIASPSKEAAKIGRFFGEGAVLGMRSTEGAIVDEAERMSGLMSLNPQPFGGMPGMAAASNRADSMAPSYVTMNVTVNVDARSASEGRAAGTSLADALYEELSRKMGSELWPVSYSAA